MQAPVTTLPLSDLRGLGPPLTPDAAGQRTDRFLAGAFPFHTRTQWTAVCRRGHLLVDGRPVRPGYKLKGGERLMIYHPLAHEPEVDTGVRLLGDYGGIIALYKPGNLPMHESGLFRRRTFGALLAERYGPDWAPVHRLDRETSGIVVCAACPKVRRGLSEDFAGGRVEKRYLAISHGAPAWDELVVDGRIALGSETRRPRYIIHPHGLTARTDFRVLARAPRAALLEARPRTGRTNQIRLHALHAGHGLVGDKIYHANPDVFETYLTDGDAPSVHRLAGYHRHALHAAWIQFTHPETGERLRVEAPLPPDLASLWASLG